MPINFDHSKNKISTDSGVAQFDMTGAIQLPVGNTTQQPAAAIPGMLRYNAATTKFELYNSVWNSTITSGDVTPISSGATDAGKIPALTSTGKIHPSMLDVATSLPTVVTSSGSADAGKVPALDVAGKLDNSLLPAIAVTPYQPMHDLIVNPVFSVLGHDTPLGLGEPASNAYGFHRFTGWSNRWFGPPATFWSDIDVSGPIFGSSRMTSFAYQQTSSQTASSHGAFMSYRLSDWNTVEVGIVSGRTITVIGWARRASGSGNMAVELEHNFGPNSAVLSGAAIPPLLGVGATVVPLTTNWAPFAVVINVPLTTYYYSGVGVTTADRWLAFNFWTSAGSDYASRTANLGLQNIRVDLWGVHVVMGAVDINAANYYVSPLYRELTRKSRRMINRNVGYLFSETVGTVRTAVFFNEQVVPIPTVSVGRIISSESGIDGSTMVVEDIGSDYFTVSALATAPAGRLRFLYKTVSTLRDP
jgi:hypothetical protein